MKKSIKYTAIAFTALIILFLSFIGYFYYRVTHMYVYQEIANDIPVSPEWITIKPTSPMKINRNFQAVSINIDGAKTHSRRDELTLSDGTVFNPEVEIFDEYGNKYNLEVRAKLVNNYDSESQMFDLDEVNFRRLEKLPQDRNYVEVRVRSDKPFLARKISWCNYDLK
jgi:hypothetical protein